jgi:superfamily I DNA/RNA helicase
MSNFVPTDEQNAIIEAFRGGDNLCIEALAGTGKTSTLKLLANAIKDEKFVYIAYNRAIADDAKKDFPKNTICKTAHSFAFGAIGRKYSDRLQGPRVWSDQLARMLRIPGAFEIAPNLWMSNKKLAAVVKGTITRFCYSDDTAINDKHVPKINGVEHVDAFRQHVVPFAQRMWEDVQNPNGVMGFEHDYYLKMFALTNPKLPGDVILLDEAQDANPCTASIFDAQKDAQRIAVGDSRQQLYAWRGAVDYLSKMDADQRLFLSQSFRFGPAVAEEANKWLTALESPMKIKGFDDINSQVTALDEPNTILCRTNAQIIVEALRASGINFIDETNDIPPNMSFPKKFAIVGGTGDIDRFAKAATSLKAGNGCDHPDLMAFSTWSEVQQFVADEASDLKVLVKLVDSHGVEILSKIAKQAVSEKDADVILSTAHKSKGREWDAVKIANDFSDPTLREDGSEPDPSFIKGELCLCYVATTRAKLKLDREGISWIDNWRKYNND